MASGSITGTTGNQFITAKVDWSSTSNTANNNSTVTATLYYRKSSSSTSPTWGTYSGGVTINGVTTTFSKYIEVNNNNTWLSIGTATATVPHNSDGKKTVTISAFGGISGISFDHTTLSGSAVLDSIPRQATITAAPNFTDEQNPTITYSNPAGNSVTSLEAYISFDGNADNIAYRSISKTGTSYTFSLTSTERDTLRSGVTNAKTKSVRFYVRTTIGSTTYTSYLTKTLTITNANPTLSPTVVDTNETTKALTGSENTLVRYYSDAKVTFGATALKKATIKSRKVTCGNKSLTADGTINAIDSGTFKFTVTDSRGYSTTKTVEPSFVNYVKLTCVLSNNKPNAQGEMLVSATGKYFNGSFGTTDNTITVYYRYKTLGGSYSDEWSTMTVTSSGTSYTASASLTGLDYQTTYVFQAYAVDKLATTVASEKIVRTVPTFDWNDTDFNVNGSFWMDGLGAVLRRNGDNNNIVLSANDPTDGIFFRPNGTGSSDGQVYINKVGNIIMKGSGSTAISMDGAVVIRHNGTENATVLASNGGDIYFRTDGHTSGTNQARLYADGTLAASYMRANQYIDINSIRFTGKNKTLWTGSWYMTGSHKVELPEAITAQPNGIVLVFSAYSGGTVQDYEFTFHFIPKSYVELKPGKGVVLFMHDNQFNYIAQKYLYIGADYITGHDTNDQTGTGNAGITFTNNRYVMRYVIGV